MAVPPPVIEISSSPGTQPRTDSTPHRLPTVSASQALQGLGNDSSSYLASGIPSLDSALLGAGNVGSGGIERGKVTELWGPIGAGKTAIALQAATNVLKNGNAVLWVDAATRLSGQRFISVFSSSSTERSSAPSRNPLQEFKHVTVPSLSHLLAHVMHPPSNFVPPRCNLLVIEDLNSLIDLDYPRYQFATSTKTEQQRWQAGRRYAILGFLVSAINKLAVLNNLAAIVTTGCVTRMRPDSGLGAALVPAIGGPEWDGGIWNRLVVFRDFGGRIVGVQKCQGKSLIPREEVGEIGRLVAFNITSGGVVGERPASEGPQSLPAQQVKPRMSPVKPRKRNLDEIADSEGEDVDEYGWAEKDDDAITAEGLIDDGQAANGIMNTG